jgi:hypothetical protein
MPFPTAHSEIRNYKMNHLGTQTKVREAEQGKGKSQLRCLVQLTPDCLYEHLLICYFWIWKGKTNLVTSSAEEG